MSSEERKKILQMVADGKISAEEAATLMRALDETAEEEMEVLGTASDFGYEKSDAPEFEHVRKRAMHADLGDILAERFQCRRHALFFKVGGVDHTALPRLMAP